MSTPIVECPLAQNCSRGSDTKEPSSQKPINIPRGCDALDSEFRYYSKLIPDLILLLPNQCDRASILPWVHKLTSPGYNVHRLRDKRNRFMLMLCMSLLSGCTRGPFASPPPNGVLPAIQQIIKPKILPFLWETDRMWENQLEMMTEINGIDINKDECDKISTHSCYIHDKECIKDMSDNFKIGETLDMQFRFLLNICKPYAAMLIRSSDRIRAAKWIQKLCGVDQKYCLVSKGIRNDYMMLLAGYLTNQCLIGPFEDYPLQKLLPLAEIVFMKNDVCIIDPTNPKTSEFFSDIPPPSEGAFAYIAITGDLYKPKF